MNKTLLNKLETEIKKILLGEIKNIINSTREEMIVVEEKLDGDSATIADIKIGEIFDEDLPKLLPGSIVIQEESFNEEKYELALKTKYVWVVDPIDGTKAFRDVNNMEWCVGVCLLEDLNPILSVVYIPEKWMDGPYLISANKYREGIYNFGKQFKQNNSVLEYKYVSHIHKDTERNEVEKKIAKLFKNNEIIRAYAGHSTLVQFAEVAINNNKIFTRRGANIWDIIQSAYLIQKNNGEVFYSNGQNVFPLNPQVLEIKDKHIIMPFTIASSLSNKNKILASIRGIKIF